MLQCFQLFRDELNIVRLGCTWHLVDVSKVEVVVTLEASKVLIRIFVFLTQRYLLMLLDRIQELSTEIGRAHV